MAAAGIHRHECSSTKLTSWTTRRSPPLAVANALAGSVSGTAGRGRAAIGGGPPVATRARSRGGPSHRRPRPSRRWGTPGAARWPARPPGRGAGDMFPGRKRGRRDLRSRARGGWRRAVDRGKKRVGNGLTDHAPGRTNSHEDHDCRRHRKLSPLQRTPPRATVSSWRRRAAWACGRCRARARGARPPSPARRATKRTRTRSRKRRRRCRRRRRRRCLVVFVGRRRHHRRDRHAGRAAGGWRRHHSPVRPERRRGDARGVPPRGQGGARRAAERRPDGVAHGAVGTCEIAGRQSHRRSAGAPMLAPRSYTTEDVVEIHAHGLRCAEGAVAAAEERGRNARARTTTIAKRTTTKSDAHPPRRRRGTSRVRSEDRRVVRSRAPRSSPSSRCARS